MGNKLIKPAKKKAVKKLLEENPDIVMAKEIMLQAKKTTKSPIILDQSNYYKLSISS